MNPLHGLGSGGWTLAAFAVLVLRLTLIGALSHLALAAMRRQAASLRHLVATAGLAGMLAVTLAFAIGSSWPALTVPVEALPTVFRTAGASLAATVALPEPARPAVRVVAEDAHGIEGIPVPEPPAVIAVSLPPTPDVPVEPAAATPRPWAPNPFVAFGVVFVVLLGIAPLLALGHVLAAVLVHRRAAAARAVRDPGLLDSLDRARAAVRCDAPIALRSSRHARVPFVTGLIRPTLILPDEATEWEDARLHAVFLHEAGHVARGDGWTLLLARAATTLAWFHPLAWSLARTAHRECERACDDLVLAAGVRPSDYAEELLAVARAAGHLAAWHAGSLAMAHPRQLEGRLLAILGADTRRSPLTPRAAAITTVATLALLIPLTSVRVVAAPGCLGASSACDPSSDTAWGTESAAVPATPETPDAPAFEGEEPVLAIPAIAEPRGLGSAGRRLTDPDGPLAAVTRFASERSHSGEEWFDAARERYHAGRYAEAAEFYEHAASAGYRAGTAWYNAGCSFSLDGQTNRALGALRHAIDEGFDDPAKFQADEDLNPLRREARFKMMIGELLDSDSGETSRNAAVRKYERLVRAGAPEPNELRSAGIDLMRSGEPRLAVEAFTRQYAQDSSASSLYNTACALAIGGRTKEALAMLERSIRAGSADGDDLNDDPDLFALHDRPEFASLVRLADDLSLDTGNWNDDDEGPWRSQVGRYERVANDHPDIGRAWFNLGFVQLRAGRPGDSRTSFLRALDLGYRRGTTSYNVACASARSGDKDDAIRWLERSEAAGLEIGSMAPWDDDLASLRGDARFRSMKTRWERTHHGDKSWREKSRDEKRKDRERIRKSS